MDPREIDFERHYGVNAGYVQALFESWRADPAGVDPSWEPIFRRLDPEAAARHDAPEPQAPAPAAVERPAPQPVAVAETDPELEPLTGVSRRIVTNMEASLEVPTATSVRTVSAKLLDENRRVLNEHMQVRAFGKSSFTHLIAYALVRALAEMPRVQSSFEEHGGRPFRRVPASVGLGLAIDVPGRDGRSLVVPNVKNAQELGYRAFYEAYEDVVRRGRAGELESADFQGTTVTLTNPGGFGTTMSVPRLMKGQGLIVATGSIGVPPELAGMSAATLADLALGPVLTITSTYDHRVVQGAESALLLQRIDALLQGEDGFYDEVFRTFRVPWTPLRAAGDVRARDHREEARIQTAVWKLINAYRVRGSRLADLDPLEYRPDPLPSLDPSSYGLTVWDLDRSFYCGDMLDRHEMSLREILATLRRAYCRRWTVEYMHITDRMPKQWIRGRAEDPEREFEFDTEHRVRILKLLSRAENFERFLHTRYVGNKRFSLEGADTLIPALAELIDRAAERGVRKVVLGMAHRGRLNVLVNILGKSYAQVFREFEGVLLPLSKEGSGDVKYHLGQRGRYRTRGGDEVEVLLCANPSHLEAVDPVVSGMTRALQDAGGDSERSRVMAVLIHGDAAFSGQGVVTETFNMSKLPAYRIGGTVHLVVNNQIGFTAGPRDLRSTYYCTDNAKGVQAPVLHANGDYPESVLRAVQLAVDFRAEFGEDAVVDMVCYRRWGHNEGDEPAYTQPVLYSRIREHPTPRDHYKDLCIRRGVLTPEEAEAILQRFDDELSRALESSRAEPEEELTTPEVVDVTEDEPEDYAEEPSPETGLPAEELVALIDRSNLLPEGHVAHSNLLRQLRRRERMVRGEEGVQWGCAEALAFGSLVREGVPVRLAGQDSGRGTFSQRHAVIRDQRTGEDYVPLDDLASDQASFEVWDSLLSEEAALAFEYGYSIGRGRALVLWEAQFGDFVNGAQIPIDQFLLSGQAKWQQSAGLVLLLPHGYDGQGPEHSNARPERFLAQCSGGNAVVCNCSTSAQYYHLLRRHGHAAEPRPLVVFTPKSLLRSPAASSSIEEFTRGGFRELIPDESARADGARRVVLCSGKVYHELAARRDEAEVEGVALLRLEQLYPLPWRALAAELERYPEAELVWCQEEPRNMGPWTYVLQRFGDRARSIRYCGRSESSSPATGSYRRHVAEQEWLVNRALLLDQEG